MPKLILVRHAAVVKNPDKPSATWPLSADGRQRAKQMAAGLAAYQPAEFITSEEAKASETGAILAAELGVACQTRPGLHEHDRTGQPYFESYEEFTAVVRRFFATPAELVFGRETAVQALARFDQAVLAVLAETTADCVAIVAHGTVLTLWLSRYNETIDPYSFWKALTMPCAFVVSRPDFQLMESLTYNPG